MTFSVTVNWTKKQATLTPSTPLQAINSPARSQSVGGFYSQFLAAYGGVAPYTYSVVSGAGPNGTSFSSIPGMGWMSGNLNHPGPYNYTVQITDSAGNTITQTISGEIAFVVPGSETFLETSGSQIFTIPPYNSLRIDLYGSTTESTTLRSIFNAVFEPGGVIPTAAANAHYTETYSITQAHCPPVGSELTIDVGSGTGGKVVVTWS